MFKLPLMRALVFFSYCYASINAYSTTLLLENVTVINEFAEASKQPVDVLIQDDRIVKVGLLPKQADRVIDGSGKFLIPGLIDSHVHLHGVPGLKGQSPEVRDLETEASKQIPRSYLYFGFTTVLDLFSSSYAIKPWNRQAVAPEALYCTGMPIINGYPMAFLGPTSAQFVSPMATYQLYDPNQKDQYPEGFDVHEHMPKRLVERAKQDGAVCVKAFFERGFAGQKHLPVPSLQLIQELKVQSEAVGMPLFLHANSAEAYEFAMAADVSVLAHGVWHVKKNAIESLVKRVVSKDIFVQPTLSVLEGELSLFDRDFFKNTDVQAAIPPALIKWYAGEEGQWFRRMMSKQLASRHGGNDRKAVNKRYATAMSNHREGVSLLTHANANLVFGSDTPSGPIYTQFPGVNGFREMQAWVRAGVDLKTLFKALTVRNAQLLGIQNRVGAIKPGMEADLLLLNSNPLNNVDAYNMIKTVILNGAVINREELKAK